LLDTAVAGTTSITVDADITLSTTTGASNEARQAIILWNPASGTTTRNITAPAQSKLYTVINASGGTQSIVIRGAGPTTGVTIAKGESAQVAWNGSDFVKVGSSGGAITFTNLTVTGNTILGDAAADTLTVNATSTFASPVSFQNLVRLPSTGRSAAAALTATAPAFLYGVASTYTDTASSGTIAALAPFYSIAQPTLSTSNVTTYTNAATLYIANAPTTGGSATITNPFALYVDSGANYFGGAATFNSTLAVNGNTTLGDATGDTLTINAGTTTFVQGTANGVAYLNGSKVLTTGSALVFDGTRLVATATTGAATTYPAYFDNSGAGVNTGSRIGFRNTGTSYGEVGYVFSGGFGFILDSANSGDTRFLIGGSEQMRLTSTGLGIGTSSPSSYGAKLAVYNVAADAYAIAAISNDQSSVRIRLKNIGSGGGDFALVGGTPGLSNAGLAVFDVAANATRLLIDASGNVGIGTSSPGEKLDVVGTARVIRDTGATNTGDQNSVVVGAATTGVYASSYGAGLQFQITNSSGGYSGSRIVSRLNADNNTANLVFQARNYGFTDSMTLDASGNLVVGNSVANERLETYKGVSYNSDPALYFRMGSGDGAVNNNTPYTWRTGITGSATGYSYVFQTLARLESSWVERARINSSGNFGIGTSSPDSKLSVYTALGANVGINHDPGVGTYPRASGIGLGAVSTSLTVASGGSTVTFVGGAGLYAENTAASGNPTNLVFWTNEFGTPSVKMSLTAGGVLDIGTGAGAVGQIRFPVSQVASTNANTLDDYEEGEWTPSLTFNNSAVGLTYENRNGRYTKIGNVVYFTFGLVLTNKGSSTGAAYVEGLPFTSGANKSYREDTTRVSVYGNVSADPATWIGTSVSFMQLKVATTGVDLTNTNFANNSNLFVSGFYFV
jgi:hypothetical protein